MTTTQVIRSKLSLAVAAALLTALPASQTFAQLAPGDGTGVAPHEPYEPCSICHVRFDQWAQAQFDSNKPKFNTTSTATIAAGFIALRDLQYAVGAALSQAGPGGPGDGGGGGGGGQGPGKGGGAGSGSSAVDGAGDGQGSDLKDVQIHPVADVTCTLCHAKFEEKHGTEMVINEDDPAASCQTSSCHKDTKKLAEMLAKIKYWTMAYEALPKSASGAENIVAGIVDRTQDAVALIPGDAVFEEGTWKHEVKGAEPIAKPNLEGVAVLLQDNLIDLTAGLPVLAGSMEGKVEAKSAVSNATLRTYPRDFDRGLGAIADLVKETKLESKYKPGHPAGAIDVFVAEVQKRYRTAVLVSLTLEKATFALDAGQIVGEFKSGETKITFLKLSASQYQTAINNVLATLDRTYRDTPLEEVKFGHTYEASGDGRYRIADAINAFASQVPDKELKYELKAKKDTETLVDVGELLPAKADQHDGQLIKLKTEYKYKVGKIEPEVKAEAAARK